MSNTNALTLKQVFNIPLMSAFVAIVVLINYALEVYYNLLPSGEFLLVVSSFIFFSVSLSTNYRIDEESNALTQETPVLAFVDGEPV